MAANTKGLCYIRLSRPATEIVYDNDETFAIGKAKILKQSDNDSVLVIAAGITMSQALPAVEQLAAKGRICVNRFHEKSLHFILFAVRN